MLLLRRSANPHAVRLSDRVMNAMPVVIAWGVNLGIVPLLFTQVAYHRVFYPATILMAWPWLSVIVMLTAAYYGVYAYVFGMRGGRLGGWRVAVGWVAAALFIVMGWLFANAFSLMTNVGAWRGLWQETSVAGAPLGTALNTGDPTLWARWLMMFGLAVTTTAAYAAFDTAVFARREAREYRAWALRCSLGLYAVGAAWFAACGAWYVFGTMAPEVRARLMASPQLALTALTAAGPAVVWLLILAAWRRAREGAAAGIGRGGGIAVIAAQFLILGLNAVSRQFVQNWELSPSVDVAGEAVNLQLGPLVLFLALFVAGLAVVIWMARQAVRAAGRPVES
jgi:hypothetical protein